MKRFLILSIFITLIFSLPADSFAQNKGIIGGSSDQTATPKQSAQLKVSVINAPVQVPAGTNTQVPVSTEYQVGPNDILDINILQPEPPLLNTVTVSPDGDITFPYIGTVSVKGKTLAQIQEDVQKRLGDGYIKYPVVSVDLKQSHSRRFFVYGEVVKPGAYDMEENMTVLGGISIAGGFSQFGSASRVKILRPKKGTTGYDVIKVNVKDVMDGVADSDPAIDQGDIIVVSEGIF